MIQWTIDAAMEVASKADIVVTTDDETVKAICQKQGLSFIDREKVLAQDESTTMDVVLDVMNRERYAGYDIVVLLQATSPLRNANHLQEALSIFEMEQADSLVSVCRFDKDPRWAFTIKDQRPDYLMSTHLSDIGFDISTPFYIPNGAIYIFRGQYLQKNATFFDQKSVVYEMASWESIDIDLIHDFVIAEAILKNGNKIV